MTDITITLTPYMLRRIEELRGDDEPLQDCILDILWIGCLYATKPVESSDD